MISITISPQTPAHMSIIGEALVKLLGLSADAPQAAAPADLSHLASEAPKAPKARKAAPTPPVSETVTATPTPASAPVEPAAASPSKPVSKEDVRAVLAEKSRAGKTPEVKALLARFGGGTLGDVPEAEYAALLTAAEAL